MTMKCALMGLPFGGGKGGVSVDAGDLSLMEKERVARGYVRAAARILSPDRDVPAPDVATGTQEMAWMVDEYNALSGGIYPHAFTGKPVALGGIEGRTPATGRGGMIALEVMREQLGLDGKDSLTIALQGFGNAGHWFAQAAVEAGHKIVAVSDSRGMVSHSDELDVDVLAEAKEGGGSVTDYSGDGAETSDDGSGITQVECDVLVLAALGGVIADAEDVDKLSCKAIVEIANRPILPAADDPLRKRRYRRGAGYSCQWRRCDDQPCRVGAGATRYRLGSGRRRRISRRENRNRRCQGAGSDEGRGPGHADRRLRCRAPASLRSNRCNRHGRRFLRLNLSLLLC